MRRNPTSKMTHDYGPVTITLFGSWNCDGPHRRPTIDVTYRQTLKGQGAPVYGAPGTFHDAINHRRVSIPVPWVRFSNAYRFRYVGGLFAYCTLSRFYRAISR